MAVVRQQRLRPLAQWCAEGLFVFCGRLFEAFSGALQGAAGSCWARVCQSVRCLRGARTLHIEDTYVSRRGRTRASSCSTRRRRSRRSASARACCAPCAAARSSSPASRRRCGAGMTCSPERKEIKTGLPHACNFTRAAAIFRSHFFSKKLLKISMEGRIFSFHSQYSFIESEPKGGRGREGFVWSVGRAGGSRFLFARNGAMSSRDSRR